MPRDTVTVPREVFEECKHWHEREDKALSKSGRGDGDYYYRRNQHQEEIARIDAALTSSDPEGGAWGVQTSIATKQESCPESAPRTETAVRDWRKSVFTYEHDDVAGHLYYFAPQTTAPGPYLTQRHVKAIVDIASDGSFAGVELIDNMPPLSSGGADTKSDGGVK